MQIHCDKIRADAVTVDKIRADAVTVEDAVTVIGHYDQPSGGS